MSKHINTFVFLFLLAFFVFLSSGCTRLEIIDKKLGEIFFNEANEARISTSTKDIEGGGLNFRVEDYSEFTKEQKDKIDEYLKENKLNRYGDATGTVYSGGTPLFNEETGESLERFEYILKKHPEFFN